MESQESIDRTTKGEETCHCSGHARLGLVRVVKTRNTGTSLTQTMTRSLVPSSKLTDEGQFSLLIPG